MKTGSSSCLYNTGFAGGRVGGIRYPDFLFQTIPRCSRRTTTDCRGCRSSLLVGRSGRCGCRRGIVLRLCCCGRFGLRGRSRPDRCRYRCRCLGKCTPVPVSCRLRRRNGYVLDRCLSSPVCFVALLRGGYGGRCGRVGRTPVGKYRSQNRLRRTAAVRCRRGKRFGFGRGCLKTETEYVRSAHTLLQD